MFRLAQLIPRTYVVVVPSTQTTMPIGVLDATFQDAALRSEALRGAISRSGARDAAHAAGR
jgi:hypothetical protein